jgi:hypothetical protein
VRLCGILSALALAVFCFPCHAADEMTESRLLFDFASPDTGQWEVVNDGVMGGRSKGHVDMEGDRLRFTGDLVTRGGGFTSIRTFRAFDLSGYDGLELEARGNGREFEVAVNDGRRYGWRTVSRRAPFDTGASWSTVRVPFSALRATVFGRPVRVAPVDLSAIERIGFYILDGKDGPFELEVRSIRAYRGR